VNVLVNTSDDVGVTQMAFRAGTGRPQDAATRTFAPPPLGRSESFAFIVPSTAVPGSTILIQASATDTKGQVVEAAAIPVVVLDAVAPVVAVTTPTSGDTVKPGQQVNVLLSAQDAGGIREVTLKATGAAAFADKRTSDPALPSV